MPVVPFPFDTRGLFSQVQRHQREDDAENVEVQLQTITRDWEAIVEIVVVATMSHLESMLGWLGRRRVIFVGIGNQF